MRNVAIVKADTLGSLEHLAARVEDAKRAFSRAWLAGEDLAAPDAGDRAGEPHVEELRAAAARFNAAMYSVESEILFIRGFVDDLGREVAEGGAEPKTGGDHG